METGQGGQPLPAQINPESGVIYKVDSRRASYGELRRDAGMLPGAAIAIFITKALRVRLPGTTNDPNVEKLSPFQIAPSSLPADIAARMEPMVRGFETVGFKRDDSIGHQIIDHFNNSKSWIVTMSRDDGGAIARVHVRTEGIHVPKTHFYCDILTETTDGRYLWSTSAKAPQDAPPGIELQWKKGIAPDKLWSVHEKTLTSSAWCADTLSVSTPDDVQAMIERHHEKIRNYHLERGVFQRLSPSELAELAVADGASSGGFAYPDVLAEMEKLRNKSSNWIGVILILAVSLVLFLWAGIPGLTNDASRQSRSWEALAILVPILFIHELGHYLAMRVFKYRNIRMFFIPYVGAAVSGQNYGVPGWKKVIVAFMGPMPGILGGGVIGFAGVVLHKVLLVKIGLMALILNGFNLLPVLPLDGGHAMQVLLFSRHPLLDAGFRIVAAGALMALGTTSGGRLFFYLGLVMLASIPTVWKFGKIAADLRKEGIQPQPSPGQSIPLEEAQAIITRVKAAFSKGLNRSAKVTARNALMVYETLCAKPPSWPATILFLMAHASAFFFALLLAAGITVARGGAFREFARQAMAQPKHSISREDIVVARGGGDTGGDVPPVGVARTTIVANFASMNAAKSAFDAARSRLRPTESVQRFGQTLLIVFPADDDAGRHDWVEQIEPKTKDFKVVTAKSGGATLRFMFLAKTDAIAEELDQELGEYFQSPGVSTLVPPWTPAAAAVPPAEMERYRSARRTYRRIVKEESANFGGPEFTEILKKANAAQRRGDEEEAKNLRESYRKQASDARRARLDRLAQTHDPGLDPAVVEIYVKRETSNKAEADRDDDDDSDSGSPSEERAAESSYAAFTKALAPLMGQVPMAGDKPQPGADRYCTKYGYASRATLLISIHATFVDPFEGARALVDWADAHECKSMKYEFLTGAAAYHD